MFRHMKKVSVVLLTGMLCSFGNIYALKSTKQETGITQQKQKVTGTVQDVLGPVTGASVVVKGTTNGTITDLDGNFSLDVNNGDVIIISFVGYIPQEIKYAGQNNLKVSLAEDTQKLEEVVVVGYGTQKKVNLTGAVGIASGEVLENRPIGNIAQGLQGVIPNLNISFNSGKPDDQTVFNIRGNTSLNGGSALLLVDGVETNDLSLLNPQDIESVSVLKDAASAAVYGARAAFGVVLITTKSGKTNQKLQVNYNNNFSWSTPSRLPESAPADQWIRAINQANINNGNGQYFSDAQVNAIDAYMRDPLNNPSAFLDTNGSFTAPGQWAYAGNTDWFQEIYKKAAFMQQHNASISGGSENSSYYGSVGYKGQDGLFAYGTDTYKRYNMSFNFNTQVTKWLQIGFRTKYNRSEANEPYTHPYMGSSPHYEVYRSFPFIPVTLPNGEFAGIEGSNFNYNIAGILAQAGRETNNADDFWYTGSFTITPVKGLAIKGDYTGNKYFKANKQHKKVIYQSMPGDQAPLEKGSPNSLSQNKYADTYQALNLWAEYKKSVGNHNMGVMAGYNQENKTITSLGIDVSKLFVNNFPVSDLASNLDKVIEGATVWAVQGGFFRLNYDYQSKYLLEVNGRYDGSSKYAAKDRWGFFPSASAGWRISEESFYEPIKGAVEYLKFRGSVGALGNQVTDGNFQYLGYLDSETLNYLMNNNIITGLKPGTLASSNITWEKVVTSNFGVDFSTFNNRLSGSFDYYIRNTNGMVRAKAYPGVLGTSGGKENIADMRTNGWELSFQWNDQIKNVGGSPLGYSISLGLSDAQSVITRFDNPTGSLAGLGDTQFYEGMKLGEIWGYQTDGFIADQAEADRMSAIQGYISKTWIIGDIRYADLNGDGKIDIGANTLADHGDKKVIGNNTPRYRFNIQGSASWKNFDLSFFFEGIAKRDIWMDSDVFWGTRTGMWQQALNQYHIDNTWTPEKTDAYFPVATFSDRSKQAQTRYLQNGAYIRLKDVSLSYTIPQNILKKSGINQLKVFVSGQNLWEASGLLPFIDPDITGTRIESGKQKDVNSNDGKVYPFSRAYSFGLNLTF